MNSLAMRDENFLKIMNDLKRMTRRVINPQLPEWFSPPHCFDEPRHPIIEKIHQRFKNGDVLYIRETHAFKKGADIRETNVGTQFESTLGAPPHYAYRASEPHWGEFTEGALKGKRCFRWRSPRYMPRKAARVFVKINLLRVERLHQISHDDAIAEGFALPEQPEGRTVTQEFPSPIYGFRKAWDEINGSGRGSCTPFKLNPWVVVIGFERVAAPAPDPKKTLVSTEEEF